MCSGCCCLEGSFVVQEVTSEVVWSIKVGEHRHPRAACILQLPLPKGS